MFWITWSSRRILHGRYLVSVGVGFIKPFRTDLRILRGLMAYPIKPANNSSSKEGLVD